MIRQCNKSKAQQVLDAPSQPDQPMQQVEDSQQALDAPSQPTVPISNAEVERGFFLMNQIKSKRRNRLGQDFLFWWMLIAKYKDHKFDFTTIASKIALTWKYE